MLEGNGKGGALVSVGDPLIKHMVSVHQSVFH